MQDVSDLVTTGQSAQILECSPENVRRKIRAGQLPVAAVVGRGQQLLSRLVVEAHKRTRRAASRSITDVYPEQPLQKTA